MTHAKRYTMYATTFVLTMATAVQRSDAQQIDTTIFGWSSRKLTGVVLSTIIPGAGQSYLGHSEKGSILTIGFFASGLMTALSENNVIGRNERLDELASSYKISNTWVLSNEVWLQMLETKEIQDRDIKRRDLFLKITIGFWVASVVDVIVFSDDEGVASFSDTIRPSIDVEKEPTTGETRVRAVLSYRF